MKRSIVLMVLMCCAALGAFAIKPTKLLADQLPPIHLEAMVPKAFGEWRAVEQGALQVINPQAETLVNTLYQEVLNRVYVNQSGYAVMLSIAYGRDQRDGMQAHVPEVCYPAQGFTITKRQDDSIEIEDRVFNVSRLTAKAPGRTEQISYFILVGSLPVGGGNKVKLAQMQYSLRGYIADGVLIRVSNISNDPESSWRTHDLFLKEMMPNLRGGLNERVNAAIRNELTPKSKS